VAKKNIIQHTLGGTSRAPLSPAASLPALLLLVFVSWAKSTAGDGKPKWLLSEVLVEEDEGDNDEGGGGDGFVPGTSKGGAWEWRMRCLATTYEYVQMGETTSQTQCHQRWTKSIYLKENTRHTTRTLAAST